MAAITVVGAGLPGLPSRSLVVGVTGIVGVTRGLADALTIYACGAGLTVGVKHAGEGRS